MTIKELGIGKIEIVVVICTLIIVLVAGGFFLKSLGVALQEYKDEQNIPTTIYIKGKEPMKSCTKINSGYNGMTTFMYKGKEISIPTPSIEKIEKEREKVLTPEEKTKNG